MEKINADAEVTNPNTKRIILKALDEELSIKYEYDSKTDKLYIYLKK